MTKIREDRGFTLVELMVAIVIGMIVMAAVYSTYRTQQKSYVLQEQVAGMQQNLRAAIFYMAREIRMAGCDPLGNSGAGITSIGTDSFGFTRDYRGSTAGSEYNGFITDDNENITYSFYDSDGDTIKDAIGRNTGGGVQPLAENIDELDFVYLDVNGVPTAVVSSIKSVQVTIVARTGKPDQGYTNNDGDFSNQQGSVIYTAPNDNYHRKLISTDIRCRNL